MMSKKLLLIIFLIIILSFNTGLLEAIEVNYELDDMKIVAENSYLKLYFNQQNTQIAVKDKKTGRVWYSNPQDIDRQENIARGNVKSRLNAQIRLYFDTTSDKNRTRDNFNHSIDENLFQVKPLEDGIKIDYQIGRQWRDAQYMPLFLTSESFQEDILYYLAGRDRSQFENAYITFSVQPREDEDWFPEIAGIDSEEFFADYIVYFPDRGVPADDDFVRDLLNNIAESRGDMDDLRDVEVENLLPFVGVEAVMKEAMPFFIESDLIENIREKTRFSAEDASYHLLNFNLDPLQPAIDVFYISFEYLLDGDNLLVRIPYQEIEFPREVVDEDGALQTYPLHTLRVLPYFSAAHIEETGYILVPDGSGALIKFGPDMVTGEDYFSPPVYGPDLNYATLEVLRRPVQQTHMPVFGLISDRQAFLGIIEEGAFMSRIIAETAGSSHSFNIVYPEFNLIPRGNISLGAFGSMDVYQKEMTAEDIQIRYSFFAEQQAYYSSMASYYGDYLEKKYELTASESDEEFPLYLDIMGSVLKRRPLLGIPRDFVTPLTSFAQSREMVEWFIKQDIKNIHLNYSGWLKGGPEHIFPESIVIDKIAGGEKEFQQLVSFMEDNGISFFPDFSLLSVYRDNFFDGFSSRRHAARDFNQDPLVVNDFHMVNREIQPGGQRYLLSPDTLGIVVDSFLSQLGQYNISALSLQHMGTKLYSDFNNRNQIDRARAAFLIEEALQKMVENDLKINLRGGNQYLLPYANSILNMPLVSSNFKLFDREIPFYQIALHGLINYTGEPLNLTGDYRYALLKNLETGAYPYYKLFYEEAGWLPETRYHHLYSAVFSQWQTKIRDYHNQAARILQPVSGVRIKEHKKVAENIFQTTFANDYQITVDYNNYQVSAGMKDQQEVFYFGQEVIAE